MGFIVIINIILLIIGVLMVFQGLGSFVYGGALNFFAGIGVIIQSSFWLIITGSVNKLQTHIYRVEAKLNIVNQKSNQISNE